MSQVPDMRVLSAASTSPPGNTRTAVFALLAGDRLSGSAWIITQARYISGLLQRSTRSYLYQEPVKPGLRRSSPCP